MLKELTFLAIFIFFLAALGYYLYVPPTNLPTNYTVNYTEINYTEEYLRTLPKQPSNEDIINELICNQIYFYNLTKLSLWGRTCWPINYSWIDWDCVCIRPVN